MAILTLSLGTVGPKLKEAISAALTTLFGCGDSRCLRLPEPQKAAAPFHACPCVEQMHGLRHPFCPPALCSELQLGCSSFSGQLEQSQVYPPLSENLGVLSGTEVGLPSQCLHTPSQREGGLPPETLQLHLQSGHFAPDYALQGLSPTLLYLTPFSHPGTGQGYTPEKGRKGGRLRESRPPVLGIPLLKV